MPRRSSSRSGGFGGRSSGGGRSFSTSRSPGYSSNSGYRSSARPNAPRYKDSRPQTTQAASRGLGGMGVGGAVATGMALGGGSALGHHIVGGMLGGHGRQTMGNVNSDGNVDPYEKGERPLTQEEIAQQQINTNPCLEFNTRFVDCLKSNEQDIARCQNIFDDLTSCQRSLI